MRKISGVCAALAFVLFVAVAAWAQAPVKVPEAKITLVPPTGYTKMDRSKLPPAAQRAVVIYSGPTVSGFTSNMNVTLHTVPPGTKATPEAARHLGDSVKQANPSYKQVAVGSITVNGEKGAYLVFSFSLQNRLQNRPMQSKQVIFVRNGQAYDFCFLAASSAYAKQIAGFDKSVNSVKWQ